MKKINIGDKMYLNDKLLKCPKTICERNFVNEIGIVVAIFKRLNGVKMVCLEYADALVKSWSINALNHKLPFEIGYYISVETSEGKSLVEAKIVAIDKNKDRIYYEITKVIRHANSELFLEIGDIKYVGPKGRPRETMVII